MKLKHLISKISVNSIYFFHEFYCIVLLHGPLGMSRSRNFIFLVNLLFCFVFFSKEHNLQEIFSTVYLIKPFTGVKISTFFEKMRDVAIDHKVDVKSVIVSCTLSRNDWRQIY